VETAFAPISSRTLIFQDAILAFDHEVNMKNLNSETKHSSIELEACIATVENKIPYKNLSDAIQFSFR